MLALHREGKIQLPFTSVHRPIFLCKKQSSNIHMYTGGCEGSYIILYMNSIDAAGVTTVRYTVLIQKSTNSIRECFEHLSVFFFIGFIIKTAHISGKRFSSQA